MRFFKQWTKALVLGTGLLAAASALAGPEASETKDRLSPETMERSVARPMDAFRASGLAAARSNFQELLTKTKSRFGPNSVEVADLLTSFGIELFLEDDADDAGVRSAAVEYLREAVPAYRAAFGPRDPEVAVALNTLGDALWKDESGDPPAETEAAFEEAYSIRRVALGPKNVETRANLRKLADVKGHPSRVKGDAKRLLAAVAMYDDLLIDAPKSPVDLAAPYIRMHLAITYALNGKSKEALEQLALAKSEERGVKDIGLCVEIAGLVPSLADALQRSGDKAAADSLGSENLLTGLLSCGSKDEQGEPQAVALN